MRILKYNIGPNSKGLHCDINGIGQYYNMFLFLKKFSKSRTGIIRIVCKKRSGYIKFIKNKPLNKYDNYYLPEKKIDKFPYPGVSFDIGIHSKTIYVKIFPTKKSKSI